MSPSAKLYIFFGVLIGGLVLALPFRVKTREPARQKTDVPQFKSENRGPVALSIDAANGEPQARLESNSSSPRVEAATAPSRDMPEHAISDPSYDPRDRRDELPNIEAQYEPLLQPLPSRIAPMANPMTRQGQEVRGERSQEYDSMGANEPMRLPNRSVSTSNDDTIDQERPLPLQRINEHAPSQTGNGLVYSEQVIRESVPSELRRAPIQAARRYRLRDGDRLVDLAERFLGDASRAGEIWELNREVIAHPEVLPLGAEILIPLQ